MDNKLVRDLAVIFGIGCLGYAMYTTAKMSMVAKKLDKTIDDLSKDITVDLPDRIVEKAVDKAVDREARRAVTEATSKAVKSITNDIHKEVKNAVDTAYTDLKDDVSKEMKRQVEKIDISDLRKEVVKAAKERVAEKFDDDLDEILNKYNADLSNVSKIYKSIADKMTGNNDNEMIFKIGR